MSTSLRGARSSALCILSQQGRQSRNSPPLSQIWKHPEELQAPLFKPVAYDRAGPTNFPMLLVSGRALAVSTTPDSFWPAPVAMSPSTGGGRLGLFSAVSVRHRHYRARAPPAVRANQWNEHRPQRQEKSSGRWPAPCATAESKKKLQVLHELAIQGFSPPRAQSHARQATAAIAPYCGWEHISN